MNIQLAHDDELTQLADLRHEKIKSLFLSADSEIMDFSSKAKSG